MLNDDIEIQYKLGISEDKRLYLLRITCEVEMTEKEFAACLISLGKDILSGNIEKDSLESSLN